MRGARQLLLEEGIPEYVLNKWTEAADHELGTTKFRNWLRFRYAWGQTPSPDNTPIPTYKSTQIYTPQDYKEMTVVSLPTTSARTEYGGPVRGSWEPPKPRLRYQQFKYKSREEAAMDVVAREKLVKQRETLVGGLVPASQQSS